LIIYNTPQSVFITPSKTATEVFVHLVFPALYLHISGTVFPGYAHSYMTMDASNAESYFSTMGTTFVGRQAHGVTHVY